MLLLINAQVFKPTHKKSFLLSVVPSFSTGGNETERNEYNFVLNLLGGSVGASSGVELGGLYNINNHTIKGAQIAGLANIAKNKLNGIQHAGLYNYAKTVEGIQLSGLINKAKRLNGIQIGLINILDTIECGASIGLINIIKKNGFRALEIAASDYQHLSFSFKSGVQNSYSIISGGYNIGSEPLYSLGLGLGSLKKLKRNFMMSNEIVWYQYHNTSFKDTRNTHAVHFRLGLMKQLGKRTAFTLTPSFFLSFKRKNQANVGYAISPFNPFFTRNNDKRENGFGFGLSAGITLFNKDFRL